MCYIFWSGGTAGLAPDGKGFADLALRGDRPSATHPGLAFTDQEGVVLPGWAQDAPGNHSRVVAKRTSTVDLAQGQRGGEEQVPSRAPPRALGRLRAQSIPSPHRLHFGSSSEHHASPGPPSP